MTGFEAADEDRLSIMLRGGKFWAVFVFRKALDDLKFDEPVPSYF